MGENIEKYPVVNAYVHHRDWSFFSGIKGKVVVEQMGAYRSTTSNMSMKVAAISVF